MLSSAETVSAQILYILGLKLLKFGSNDGLHILGFVIYELRVEEQGHHNF